MYATIRLTRPKVPDEPPDSNDTKDLVRRVEWRLGHDEEFGKVLRRMLGRIEARERDPEGASLSAEANEQERLLSQLC
jgi:hypothetical protein